VPDATEAPRRSSTSSLRARKGRPHSYLSLVDGTVARHATWAECERRVKGRSGARYKKAMSAGDERQILGEWGHSPSELD